MAARQRRIGDGREIDMAPWFPRFCTQFMDVVIVADEHQLFGTALSPTIASGHADGWRSAGERAHIRVLPCSPGAHPQFMHMPILRQIGHLLRPALWPGIAEDKATAGQRSAGKLGHIRVLPRSSHADRKFMDMVILADISHLFGPSLRPIIADKWFHTHLLLCALEACLKDTPIDLRRTQDV